MKMKRPKNEIKGKVYLFQTKKALKYCSKYKK